MFVNFPLPLIVAAAIAILIPHLSSLVTRQHWSDGVAGLFTLLFSAADGLVVELVHAGSDFSWRAALSKALVAFVTAIISRYGLLKGTPLDGQLRAIGSKTAAPAAKV